MDYIEIENLFDKGLITEEQEIASMIDVLLRQDPEAVIKSVTIGGHNVDRINYKETIR